MNRKLKHPTYLLFPAITLALCALGFFLPVKVSAQPLLQQIEKELAGQQSRYIDWYKKLHASPEVSTKEINTAAFLKQEMRAMGFEITDSLGLHSFAAILRNGKGPVLLYRTDMDGLPLEEKTGLPFASTTSAMHACGHDIHMSSWMGTARMMATLRKQWSGTLVFLAQSAEETAQGAKAVIAAPNFKLVPKPDIQLAFHDHAELLTGQAGFCDGYSMAAVDMMNITIRGKGGHGAAPEKAIDPVLLASQYVVAIQSILSRNLSSNDRAVITVGAINGGTVGNIIPDQVVLKLTIRSFSQPSRQLILNRLKTIGDQMARGAGLPEDRLPVYDLLDMSIPSVYNDPSLGARLRNALTNTLGDGSVAMVPPIMIGEDFGVYGQTESRIPSYIMWAGTVSPDRKSKADKGQVDLPSLHSPRFAPDYELAIPGAVKVMTVALFDFLGKGK